TRSRRRAGPCFEPGPGLGVLLSLTTIIACTDEMRMEPGSGLPDAQRRTARIRRFPDPAPTRAHRPGAARRAPAARPREPLFHADSSPPGFHSRDSESF